MTIVFFRRHRSLKEFAAYLVELSREGPFDKAGSFLQKLSFEDPKQRKARWSHIPSELMEESLGWYTGPGRSLV